MYSVGHYRVDYDARTWNLIAEALLNEPESIHYLNRGQVGIYLILR